MKAIRLVIAVFLIVLAASTGGCIQRTITDDQIDDAFQAWLDAPYEAYTDEIQGNVNRSVDGVPKNVRFRDYLTAEERATIEDDFTHYKNTVKIQLVEGTPHELWETVGAKCARAFAMACRDASSFEIQYICELRIYAEVDGSRDNFVVGELKFSNRLERITPDIYLPSRSRN